MKLLLVFAFAMVALARAGVLHSPAIVAAPAYAVAPVAKVSSFTTVQKHVAPAYVSHGHVPYVAHGDHSYGHHAHGGHGHAHVTSHHGHGFAHLGHHGIPSYAGHHGGHYGGHHGGHHGGHYAYAPHVAAIAGPAVYSTPYGHHGAHYGAHSHIAAAHHAVPHHVGYSPYAHKAVLI